MFITETRRPCAIALAFGLAAVVAGCGSSGNGPKTLNAVTLERAIAKSILTERHIYTLVTCPAKMPQQQGRTFTCQAKLAVGTYPMYVTETDNAGHVRYANSAPLVTLNTAKVAHAIEASVLAQRHLHARVSCPSGVLQRKGLSFTCTAHIGSGHAPFAVTVVDRNGHVRYVGR